ncbi:unnamed protein product [Echinostoma caproni]|uniref:Flocculation protein FLO11-like n=1 Tax=Echinostoma caproni TaxID=27848 RepID=A0A183BFB0_9TREM|nr:unnamed protein product [Echinostoma caproni]
MTSKSVNITGSSFKTKHQPAVRPRGRPRKTPRPSAQTPPQLGSTESDNSLPNSPPHLSTVSSSSPSSASIARRNTSFCPSPVSSSIRADSPAARSISAGSDALSTNASIGTAPLEASASTGPTTPTVPVKSSPTNTQIPTTPAIAAPTPCDIMSDTDCSVLEQSIVPVKDPSPPRTIKRGRGRPPKSSRATPPGSNTSSVSSLSSQKRASKRPLGQVTAFSCPWAESSDRPMRMDLGDCLPRDSRPESRSLGPVHLPSVLNQILTGYRSRSAFGPEVDLNSNAVVNRESNSRQKPYVPLVDPFNGTF